MKKRMALCAIAAMLLLASSAHALPTSTSTTITIIATPDTVPDEQLPRVNYGDAPVGFGVDSWQGPATGKSNWHARYQFSGDYLSALFPDDAAAMTLADIASISYWTKRPDGTLAARDWWVTIYTRPYDGEYTTKGANDASFWYHAKYTSNYGTHTAIDTWTQYSTGDGSMLFNNQTLSAIACSDLIECITIQTDSGWNGFDGYVDGLVITLANGNVGIVNFEAVPEPATMSLLALGGLFFARRKK